MTAPDADDAGPTPGDAELVGYLIERVRSVTAVCPGDVVVFQLGDDANKEHVQRVGDALTGWFAEHAPGINVLLVAGFNDVFAARSVDLPDVLGPGAPGR